MSTTIERSPRAETGRTLPPLAVTTAILALIGVLVFFYPSAAAWFSQYQQSQTIASYSGAIRTIGPQDLDAQLEQARAYNEAISGGASLEPGQRIPIADPAAVSESFDYEQLLRSDSTGLMARLKIPAIAVDLPVYHGTSEATLNEGVGHLEGTALPVGGTGAHSVLTAHRGLASAGLFTHLDRVDIGDTFTIEVFGEVLSYRVVETRVVEPDKTQSLFPQSGRDLVTLVTCTPLGVNSHRILVTGERITPTPIADVEQAGQVPDVPGFPWWAAGVGACVIGIGAFLGWTRRLHQDPGGRGAPLTPASPRGGEGQARHGRL